jgi:transcription elongation factor Elf1
MLKTYDVTCPNCGHEFTVDKTDAELEDETDETTCPSCGMVALAYLEEDGTLTLVDEYDDEDDEDEDGTPLVADDDEDEDEEDKDQEEGDDEKEQLA